MQTQSLLPNARAGTVALAVTANSAVVAVPAGGGIVYNFLNRGGGDAFIEFCNANTGAATVPATNTPGSAPVLANLPVQYVAPAGTTHIAMIGSANCTVYATRGSIG